MPNKRKRKKEHKYDLRILDVARVTRVIAGGRRFSFRVVAAFGDHKGKIGIDTAKSKSVSAALDKIKKKMDKKITKAPLTKDGTIPCSIKVKFKAARIILKPRSQKIIAGGVIRTMAQLAGFKGLTAKILGTNNKLNNAKAFMKAIEKLKKIEKSI